MRRVVAVVVLVAACAGCTPRQVIRIGRAIHVQSAPVQVHQQGG